MFRNEIKIVDVEKEMKIVKTITAHPRRESRIRIMTQNGLGIWVSIRLDSTLRLYHAISGKSRGFFYGHFSSFIQENIFKTLMSNRSCQKCSGKIYMTNHHSRLFE